MARYKGPPYGWEYRRELDRRERRNARLMRLVKTEGSWFVSCGAFGFALGLWGIPVRPLATVALMISLRALRFSAVAASPGDPQ